MQNIIQRYEKVLRVEGKSESTIKSYSANLKAFFTYTQSSDFKESTILDFLDALLRRKIEHSTYNQVMYSILNYCRIFGRPFPTLVKKLRVRRKEEFIPQKEDIIKSIYVPLLR